MSNKKRKKKGVSEKRTYEKVNCIHVDHEGEMAVYVKETCKGDSHFIKGQKVVYRLSCYNCPYREDAENG